MRKIFVSTLAATAMFLGASSAYALDEAKPYITGSGDSRMIMDGSSATGARLLSGENGAAPSECPAGAYYEGGQNQIVACEGGMTYGMMAPPAGAMMSDGQAYPEGAMMLESREGTAQ